MNATVEDLRPTIIPKSDQLNAEQLLGGPMTVTVTDVRIGNGEDQPVVVHYEGENGRPFKPCKTMRKVLIYAWGPNGRGWIGNSMTLYNDPAVKFGGEDVGGIRISHMSNLAHPTLDVSLTSTRGKKAKYKIKRLESTDAAALAAIKAAGTQEAAKAAFGSAWKAAGKDEARKAALKAAYDQRMADLATPTDPLAPWMLQINTATSEEAAALVLDEARGVLTGEDFDALVQAFKAKWGQ